MRRAATTSSNVENAVNIQAIVPVNVGRDASDGLNVHLPVAKSHPTPLPIIFNKHQPRRRHLDCRPSDFSSFIDSRIEEYVTKCGLQLASLGDPCILSSDSITVAGRIVSDGEGRMTAGSVVLETGKKVGGGRVGLELSGISQLTSLFPGQVVVCEGVNSDGRTFKVTKFIHPKLEAIPMISLQCNVSMAVAMGPFPAKEGNPEDYDLLESILEMVFDAHCSVLILLGPFIDANAEAVKLGRMDKTPEDLFKHVLSRLALLTANTNCTVLLVMNPARDLLCDPVYPSSMFYSGPLPDRVFILPSPSLVNIGGANVSLNPVDILMHLGAEEVQLGMGERGNDRLGRLSAHLIDQSSHYPLHPPPSGVNIDYSQSGDLTFDPHSSHIYLSGSVLKPFARVLGNGAVFINPGRGQLAMLSIQSGMNQKLSECLRSEFIKVQN